MEEKKESNFRDYIIWLIICSIYSIFKMFKESGGDLSRYYRPFEEFLIHLFVIVVIGGICSIVVNIFARSSFGKVLIWTTIIVGVVSIMGGILADNEIQKRNQSYGSVELIKKTQLNILNKLI